MFTYYNNQIMILRELIGLVKKSGYYWYRALS